MMLAQAITELPSPNLPGSIGWVLIIITTIIVAIRQVVGLVRDLKEKPSSGEVMNQANEKFATKPEIVAVRMEIVTVKSDLTKQIEKVDQDLQDQKSSIIKNGEERKKSIEGKVEAVSKDTKKDIEGVSRDVQQVSREVSKLEGKFEQINITLVGLTSAVQNLQSNQGKE